MSDFETITFAVFYSAMGLLCLTWLGNLLCRGLFALTGLTPGDVTPDTPPDAPPDAPPATPPETAAPPAGRVIGGLERTILALGILVGSWEAVAAVIALKTVARFKKLEEKTFAEYFLVGSFFSLLWAFVTTALWIFFDETWGLNLRAQLVTLYTP